MKARFCAAVCAVALCAGCSAKPKVECGGAEATAVTTDLIRDQIAKAVTEALNSAGGEYLQSNIRATLAQLNISLADVRTSKEDPNSTKRFCTATLKVVIPQKMISDANSSREGMGLGSIAKLADDNNVDQNADAYSGSFDYDVQPTDNGQKIYSETSDDGKIKGFYAEVVAGSLMKGALEAKHAQEQAAAAAQAAQQNQAAEEEKTADQAQAKSEHDLSTQTLVAVWKNLTPDTRNAMLVDQRNWMRKKDADCDVEAAASSTDATAKETVRLKCDTKANQARTAVLQAAAADGPGGVAPPPPPPPQAPY